MTQTDLTEYNVRPHPRIPHNISALCEACKTFPCSISHKTGMDMEMCTVFTGNLACQNQGVDDLYLAGHTMPMSSGWMGCIYQGDGGQSDSW